MRHILIGPHENHAAFFPIDLAHGIDIALLAAECAKGFFVVAQAILAFCWKEQCWHGGDGQMVMALLEDGTDIKHAVDICAGPCVAHNGGLRGLGEPIAELANGRIRASGITSCNAFYNGVSTNFFINTAVRRLTKRSVNRPCSASDKRASTARVTVLGALRKKL